MEDLVSKNTGEKIIVVCGPTASGKTTLALNLCRAINGEVVCADSMQVYKGLVVGTAALPASSAGGVPQHLAGFVHPGQQFSVAEYLCHAKKAISAITMRGKVPVLCGGTGLYIKALLEGITFDETDKSHLLRTKLQAQWQACGAQSMLAKLAAQDVAYAAKLNLKDQKRILRALEQQELTGKTKAQRDAASRAVPPVYNAFCAGLNYINRQTLYNKIGLRVDDMLQQGILQEARQVYANRQQYVTAAQAIGYKEFFAYFKGEQTLAACTEKLKQATRNYAKRQITWFRHMPQLTWFYWETCQAQDIVEQAKEFLLK